MARTVLILLLWALLTPGRAAAQTGETLTLGVQAYRPRAVMEERFEPLRAYLADALPGAAVRLRVLSLDELEAATATNELDLVLANPAYFLLTRSENTLTVALATLVREAGGRATSSLGGVIFTRADRADITLLHDLPGRRVATPGRGHLGGYKAQAYELMEAGVELPGAADLVPVDSHDAAVGAVLEGRAEVGFVRTGILEALTREGRLDPARLRVLNPQPLTGFPYVASTRLYPEWPLVALPQVGEDTLRRLAPALLALEPEHPVAAAMGIHGFAPAADYLPVENLARALKLPPYDRPPEFTLRDVWTRHRLPILAIAAAMAALAGLMVLLAQRNRALTESEASLGRERQRLANVIDGTRAGTWEWNVRTGETVFNERWAEIIGYRLAELQPVSIDTWRQRTHPDDLAHCHEQLHRHLAGDSDHYEAEMRMRHRDGHWLWILDRGKVVATGADGEPLWMAGTHTDIDHRHRSEDRLRLAASVFTHAREGILITDPDGTIIEVNAAFTLITGYPREEAVGRNPRFLQSGRHGPEFYAEMWRDLVAKGHWYGEVWNRRKDGQHFAELLTVSAVQDADGVTQNYVGLFSDITLQKEHQDQLEHIAHYDALTSLPNRVLLSDRLHQAMVQTQRRNKTLAVVFLDLDVWGDDQNEIGRERWKSTESAAVQ